MEKFDSIFKEIQVTDNSSITFTVFCLLLTLFCSYILKYTFEKKSNSLSSKYQLSNMLPILSGTTFLVILIVKSSLALSLGLVGAPTNPKDNANEDLTIKITKKVVPDKIGSMFES
tara:strand:+ start:400 stop:747 length:348 start_codon:yes stop_codon:yes gene_type:complete